MLSPVPDLAPRSGYEFQSALPLAQIYETPFAPGEEAGAKPVPVLLARNLVSEGGDVLAAPVRSGIRFADGSELTAELLAERLAAAPRLAEHAAVSARDGEVVFHLKRPNPQFELMLTLRDTEVYAESGGTYHGTGPFMPAPDSRPERVRLVRNPHYRAPVPLDELVFTVYPPDEAGQPEALIAAIAAGEVDFTNQLTREDLSRLQRVRKWLEPGSSTAILYFNVERPALADPAVRRALALAIDRTEVAKLCYPNPLLFTANGLLPPLMSTGGAFRDGIVADFRQAAVRLASAEVEKPSRLTMITIFGARPYLPQPAAVAGYLVEQLGKLDIEVEVRPSRDRDEYFRAIAGGDYDLALSGWVADTPDPGDFLETLLASDAIPTPGRRIVAEGNLARWRDAEVDRAVAAFRADPSSRNRDRVLERVRDEMPLFPLMYGSTVYAYSPRVKGLETSPLGLPSFASVELVD